MRVARRVGVEGSWLFADPPTGVTVYGREVCRALARARPDWDIRVTYFLRPGRPEPAAVAELTGLTGRRAWLPGRLAAGLAARGRPPRLDLATGFFPDAWVFPNFVAWPTRAPSAVVVHDTAFADAPHLVDPDLRRELARDVPAAVRRARTVVTVSAATRERILGLVETDPARVVVVPNGVDHSRFCPADPSHPAAGSSGEPYVLFVGTLEPRKNVRGVLTAMTLLPAELRVPLVLAGQRSPLDPHLDGAITLARAAGVEVRELGYVADAELPGLYRRASALVLVSYWEGFGIPVLEAMASGTPVVASARAALPDVVGAAGLLVDPASPPEIAEALARVLGEPGLADRLREAGLARAAELSWDAAGEALARAVEGLS